MAKNYELEVYTSKAKCLCAVLSCAHSSDFTQIEKFHNMMTTCWMVLKSKSVSEI